MNMPTLQIWLTDADYERLIYLKQQKAKQMTAPQYGSQLIREGLDSHAVKETGQ